MKNIEIQVVSILLINNGIPIETQLVYFYNLFNYSVKTGKKICEE